MTSRNLISKGEYASHRGVSAARLSQYIGAGYLDDALFHADGSPAARDDRSARVDREEADRLLRARLNTSQVLGQGKALPPKPPPSLDANDIRADDGSPPPVPSSPPPSARPVDDTADRLAALKLERAERDNEEERREFLAKRGVYALTVAVRQAIGKMLSDMLAAFEAWLIDDLVGKIADASAAADGKPLGHRELRLMAKAEFRTFRAARAEAARHRRDAADPFMPDPEEVHATPE